MNIKCPKCDGKFKEKYTAKVFLDKYIEMNTKTYECKECGYELVPLDEVERIYQKIRKQENAPFYIKFLDKIKTEFRVPATGLKML